MKSKQSKWVTIGLIIVLLAGTLLIYRQAHSVSVKEAMHKEMGTETHLPILRLA